MTRSDDDVMVMRSVFISRALDDKLNTASLKLDVGSADLISKLIELGLRGLEQGSPEDPTSVQHQNKAAMVPQASSPAWFASARLKATG